VGHPRHREHPTARTGSILRQSGGVPYGSCGWPFKQVNHGGDAGFKATAFDDSDFSSGCGAFGHDAGGCGLTTQTNWDLDTDMLLRRSVTIPSGATMVTVGIAIDNDVFVYWDGSLIGSLIHEGCAAFDSLVATAPSTPGSHILAVRGIDRGIVSFLDLSVSVS
jgi:hypothetical protein